jgi:hypothetical protein
VYPNEAGRLGNLVLTGCRDHPLPQAKYTPVQPSEGITDFVSEYVYLAKEALGGRIGETKVEAPISKVIETKREY